MKDGALGIAALLLMLVSGFLWFRAAMRVSLPANRTGFVLSWVVAAALGLAALAGEPGWPGGIAAVLALLLASFGLFTAAISAQKVASNAIAVGDTLPAFTALDEDGEVFDSASLAGHPVLIKFFRAHW